MKITRLETRFILSTKVGEMEFPSLSQAVSAMLDLGEQGTIRKLEEIRFELELADLQALIPG